MFVGQDLTIDIGYSAAQARFANLLRGSWLTEVPEAACRSNGSSSAAGTPAGRS